MNFDFVRSRALYLGASLFLCLYLARLLAGFQGIENRFSWAWAFVALIAGMVFHFTEPIIFAAYIHAVKAWHWHHAISALFATGPVILLGIYHYFSNPRARKPSWPAELISIPIFILMLCLGVAMFAAGFEGIENGMGLAWAIVAIAAFTFFRLDLPLGAGAYFHATNAWNWNPAIALLFVASPVICLLIGCRINEELIPAPFVEPLAFQIRRHS
jgi:hypothetical protein